MTAYTICTVLRYEALPLSLCGVLFVVQLELNEQSMFVAVAPMLISAVPSITAAQAATNAIFAVVAAHFADIEASCSCPYPNSQTWALPQAALFLHLSRTETWSYSCAVICLLLPQAATLANLQHGHSPSCSSRLHARLALST